MSEFLIPILHQLPEQEQQVIPDVEEMATPASVFVKTGVEVEEKQPAPTENLLAEIEELKQLAYEKAYAEGLAAGKSEASKQAALDVQKSLMLIKKSSRNSRCIAIPISLGWTR